MCSLSPAPPIVDSPLSTPLAKPRKRRGRNHVQRSSGKSCSTTVHGVDWRRGLSAERVRVPGPGWTTANRFCPPRRGNQKGKGSWIYRRHDQLTNRLGATRGGRAASG